MYVEEIHSYQCDGKHKRLIYFDEKAHFQVGPNNRSDVDTPEQQKQSMEVRPLCELDAKENDSMLSPCSPQQIWQQWQWRYHWRQMRWSSSKSMWLTSGAHRLHHWHQPPCPLCTTNLAAMAMEIPLETDEVELLKGYVAHKWSPPTPSLAPTPVPPMHNKSGSNGNGDTTGDR